MRGVRVGCGMAAVALVLAACTLAPPAAAATTHVHIANFLFNPPTITIKVGDTVTWDNHDPDPHTVTRASGPQAFDSGNMGRNDVYSRTFTAEGSFDYICKYHPTMVGTVNVEAAPPPPNRAPAAAFTFAAEGLILDVDGTGSADPDGDALTYTWSWGDGTPAGRDATMSHTYAQAGTYTLRLTVSDGELTDFDEQAVTLSRANRAPVAQFTTQTTGLMVVANASASVDPDGDPLTFSWDWGDGSPATSGKNASHTYAIAGNYTIELRASDGALVGLAQRAVEVVRPNRAPVASFVAVMDRLDLRVNASASHDPDGDALAFAWDWGDGRAGVGATADHSFAAPGNYAIRLNVSDGRGLFATSTQQVTAERGNRAPLADFDFVLNGSLLVVNASASMDPDGDALTFEWDWGDASATASGREASHTFAAAGSFTVRLTVRDATAASIREQIVVVVAEAPPPDEPSPDEPPILTLTSGPLRSSPRLGALLEWSGTASDPEGKDVTVRARIVGGGTLPVIGAWRLAWTPRVLGEHVVEIIASDGTQDSEPLELRVLVTENAPPAALPVLSVVAPRVDGATTLEGVWSDPERSIVRVEVSFGNGTWRPAEVSANGTWRLEWNASEYPPGLLEFSVRVSDERATVVEGPYDVRVERAPALAPDAAPPVEVGLEQTADAPVPAPTASAPTPAPAFWLVALVVALLTRRSIRPGTARA